MGQKVNSYCLRIGINKGWRSSWYAKGQQYVENLTEDLTLRRVMASMPELQNVDIADIQIIRKPQLVTLVIYTSRPGILIGVKGANIEKLTSKLSQYSKMKILIKIRMIHKPEASAQLLAIHVARQLKQRPAWRRTLKLSLVNAMRSGIQGVKIKVAGRLGGAEMSQNKTVKEGRIPLHTLRADIDYGFAEAHTKYGAIGVKVWIFKGELLKKQRVDAGNVVLTARGANSPVLEGNDSDA